MVENFGLAHGYIQAKPNLKSSYHFNKKKKTLQRIKCLQEKPFAA